MNMQLIWYQAAPAGVIPGAGAGRRLPRAWLPRAWLPRAWLSRAWLR